MESVAASEKVTHIVHGAGQSCSYAGGLPQLGVYNVGEHLPGFFAFYHGERSFYICSPSAMDESQGDVKCKNTYTHDWYISFFDVCLLLSEKKNMKKVRQLLQNSLGNWPELDDAHGAAVSHLVKDPAPSRRLELLNPVVVPHAVGVVEDQSEFSRLLTQHGEFGRRRGRGWWVAEGQECMFRYCILFLFFFFPLNISMLYLRIFDFHYSGTWKKN